jgi:hypothetical protein
LESKIAVLEDEVQTAKRDAKDVRGEGGEKRFKFPVYGYRVLKSMLIEKKLR